MALTIKMRIDEQPEHSYVFSTGDGGQIELIPLSVVQNGSYTPADGTAYNLVTVNVPQTELEHLNITANGTYTAEDGTAYDVVTVNVQPILEAVTRSYTENGTYTIVPSEGNDGLSGVTVTVNVPTPTPRLEAKTVSYDTNGTYSVVPSIGYDGLASVSVGVNVQGGGGVTNVDIGEFDAGMLTEGAANVLFQFRTNENPLAFYIFSDDPVVASTPTGETLISFNGISNQNAGIPYDFFVGQSYFDGSMGNLNAYAGDSDLSQVTVDGGMENNVIGCDTNNNVIGFVMDTNNTTGYGLVGIYHYVVVYDTVL